MNENVGLLGLGHDQRNHGGGQGDHRKQTFQSRNLINVIILWPDSILSPPVQEKTFSFYRRLRTQFLSIFIFITG